jgi:hypothetical protein
MQKVVLRLEAREWEALVGLALTERRPLQNQVEYIVVQELERRGLLQPENPTLGTEYGLANLSPAPQPQST